MVTEQNHAAMMIDHERLLGHGVAGLVLRVDLDQLRSFFVAGGNEDVAPAEYEGPGPDPCNPPDTGTEVDSGLDWLKRHMVSQVDGTGYWSLVHSNHPDCDPSSCSEDSFNGYDGFQVATAFALMPMLGSGNSTASGPYQNEVCRGVADLIKEINTSGGALTEGVGKNTAYSHAICFLALAQALILSEHAVDQCPDGVGGCTVDIDELRTAVEMAAAYMAATQRGSGGWGYHTPGDMSHHSWPIAAFLAAERAGVDFPSSILDDARDFMATLRVGEVTDANGVTLGEGYGYANLASDPAWALATPRSTGHGLLAEVFLGAPKDHPAIIDFITDSSGSTVTPEYVRVRDSKQYVVYNCHIMSLLCHAAGDPYKADWNEAMENRLLDAQITSGHAKGSWSQNNPDVAGGGDASSGGRHYVTCMYLLSLQEYYSKLRLGE
jgi:hypothetical protein